MKTSRLSALAMSMVLLVTCFVSVPVFPGENPWDADLSGGSGGTVIVVTDDSDRDTLVIIPDDTVIVADDTSSYSTQSSPAPTWWDKIVSQVAVWFASPR